MIRRLALRDELLAAALGPVLDPTSAGDWPEHRSSPSVLHPLRAGLRAAALRPAALDPTSAGDWVTS